MVDLNIYRISIGTFQNKSLNTKSRRTLFQSKISSHQHSVGRGSRLRTLVLLWVMTAAVVVCIPLLHQERDSAVDETLHPAVRTNREQLNQVTDPLVSCLWKVYHSIISGYRNGWLSLKPSAVSCDSVIHSYANGWMTLPPSAVSCDSVLDNYTNVRMTLPPSAVSCDSVIDNYTNGWMTLPPSAVSCDSVIDNYTNGCMTQPPSAVSCDSVMDNYTNRWMTLPPSAVSCDSVVDKYTNGWMTLPPSTVSCDSVVDNYTNRWMTLPPSAVSCDSVIDNYTNRWMTLPPSAVSCDSVVDSYANRWMTLPPSAVSYDSVVDNYTNRWMTLPPSAVFCDSVVDSYTNRWMTLPPSTVSCDSIVDNYTNRWMTLPPSAVSCDSVVDSYANRWMTLPPSAVSYDSVVDNYTNRWMTLPPSAVSCDSVVDNYTNRWMTLPPSTVSCDSVVDNYTNRWMTLPPSAVFCDSVVDNYTNRWMTLPPSAVSCDSVVDNYTNRWKTLPPSAVSCDSVIDSYTTGCMTLPPLAVSCDSVVDNYTNRWMTLPPSAVSCDSVTDNYTNRWMTLPPSAVSCDSIVDNYTNGWMTLPPSAENDICPVTEKQSQRTCSYLIGNAGLHAYNGNPPMHGGEEEDVHVLHCEMIVKLSDLVYPGMGSFWEKFVFMLKVYLTPEEISGANNIFNVCETLELKGRIKHGEYGVLKKIFASAGLKQCCEIVEEYSQKIEGTRRKPLPLLARKRSRQTSPQPQESSAGDLPIKVDVVSESPPSPDKNHMYDAMMDFMMSVLGKIVTESETAEEMMTKFEQWLLLYENVRAKRNCLMIYVTCGSRKALNDLWQMYQSGELLEILQNGLITRDLLAKCGMESIQLGVFISEEDYERCLRNIAEPITTDHAVTTEHAVSTEHAVTTTRQATNAGGCKLETGEDDTDTEMKLDITETVGKQDIRVTEDIKPDLMETEREQDIRVTEGINSDTMETENPDIMETEISDTRDTENIQPGIMEIETKRDTRDIEDIQPGIMGIETKQDTRDTEDIQPGIMGMETQQDTRDTEDIQPGIMEIETKRDTRNTEDIQPGIMGIETKQDTRDTEDIQPGIMGIETKHDTRDTEDIQPGIMGIGTKHDTRDTEDIQPGIMGIETKQDTRDTEDIQPGIMGIETKHDTRDTEDIQPDIIGIETKHDTRDTEDIQPDIIGMETQQDIEDSTVGECSMDTPLFKEDNTVHTALEKDVTETGQDFKEWVPPTAGIAEQLIVKREEFRTSQEDVVDVLAQHAAGFGAGETVYSRDTAAFSHKMPSGEETRRLHEVVDALARHAYATGFGAAETVYSQDTAASSHNKMPSVDMEASVKVWGDNEKLCYETKGIKEVVQKIYSEEHSYICVVGEPGCGKSTAIRHAALYLKDKLGFIIYPVSGPKQFIDYLDPDKPQVFIFDDFCGEYFIDQDKLKAWGEYNEKIKDCLQVHKNTKVLFSLRVQLHSELKSKGNTHIYNDQRHVINFSDKEYKLSRDTMQDMLRHYLQVQHVQNIKGLIRRVRWGRAEQFAGCFPLLCKVFSEDESVRVDPEKYFSDPWPALQNIFKRIKSDNKHQFCGLLLCGVTDLKDEYFSTSYKQNKPQQFDSLIESQSLDPRKDLSDIKSALQALDGVYISHIGNRYTFLHSIFQNIVTFLYDDKYYVFKYATLDFIDTRVRLFSKFDTDDDYVKVFYGDDCVELLVDRMIEELRSDDTDRWREGARFIVDSHYIDNKELITCLMEKLFDSKHTQITQDKIDKLFVKCLGTVCIYTPSPPHTDVTSCPQYQLLLSLIARCDCNKQIKWLLWDYPLLISVYLGSLPVTKFLVEHQADVNVVDSLKRCVLHWAVDCYNNVDMTKYLLRLPNLKCLNHRDSDGHTPYWYVVNNKSPTPWSLSVRHRDELMKLYKHTAAICE